MQSTGIEGTYVLRDLRPDDIDAFVAELRGGRYTGCNVTTPYKAVRVTRNHSGW
jgi:shikimate 5-dehydrogenase